MNPYTLKLVSGPASEPITLAQAKDHLHEINSAYDTYITGLITVARKVAESKNGRPIGVQRFELGIPYWYPYSAFYADYYSPDGYPKIEFPAVPLAEIISIKYTKLDGTEVTLVDTEASPPITSDLYFVETASEPGFAMLKYGQVWPIDILRMGYPIKIVFTAGLDPVPEHLIQAIKLFIGHFYENREEVEVSDSRVQALEVPQAGTFLCQIDRFERMR